MAEGLGSFIYIGIFFAILYFLMIRPQQKQQKKRKEMLGNVKVNDAIVTIGGMHGRITKIRDEQITLRIADKIEVDFDKSAIGYVQGKE